MILHKDLWKGNLTFHNNNAGRNCEWEKKCFDGDFGRRIRFRFSTLTKFFLQIESFVLMSEFGFRQNVEFRSPRASLKIDVVLNLGVDFVPNRLAN